jgi:hypothetical protein
MSKLTGDQLRYTDLFHVQRGSVTYDIYESQLAKAIARTLATRADWLEALAATLGVGGSSPETILVAGAVSASNPVSYLSGASGSYAVTLAAPDASMIGKTKLIEYTVGAGVVTLNATNIDDASEFGPTLDNTFSVVGQNIVLLGLSNKWLLIAQAHTA